MGEGNSISEGLEAGRHVMNGSGKLPVSMAAALEDKWSGAAPGNKAATHLGVSRLVKCGKFQLRGAVSIKGASLVAQRVKNPPANTGDPGLIPESGRSPGGGHSNPFQGSCLENPVDREAWRATVHGVAKSWTRLSDCTFTFTYTHMN